VPGLSLQSPFFQMLTKFVDGTSGFERRTGSLGFVCRPYSLIPLLPLFEKENAGRDARQWQQKS